MLKYVVSGIIALIVLVYTVVLYWRIFQKSGHSGWIALIPFANMWVLFKIGALPGILSLIPIVNVILYVVVKWRIVRKFGMGIVMAIFGIVFPYIPLTCIAFNDLIEYDF